jgi:type I restriction enzyme S subunit
VFEVIDAVADRSSALDGLQNSLNQSILAKAFRGALVPQDPNDEPAQVLLDRIRRERDGQGAATAKRGRKPAIGT